MSRLRQRLVAIIHSLTRKFFLMPGTLFLWTRTIVLAVFLIGVSLHEASARDDKYLCSEVFRSFKSAINAHDKHLMKYAAFAKGRAFTITGMKGCGWAHGEKTQAKADRLAMKNCRANAKNPDKCYIALRYKD